MDVICTKCRLIVIMSREIVILVIIANSPFHSCSSFTQTSTSVAVWSELSQSGAVGLISSGV